MVQRKALATRVSSGPPHLAMIDASPQHHWLHSCSTLVASARSKGNFHLQGSTRMKRAYDLSRLSFGASIDEVPCRFVEQQPSEIAWTYQCRNKCGRLQTECGAS